jgi:hypothetical protein
MEALTRLDHTLAEYLSHEQSQTIKRAFFTPSKPILGKRDEVATLM